ncbi:MAG: erythromycin esterase family protein [Gemmatimonadota bacterium]|nr:erythromycin esterase family protein [Gemmatimonadota bacterium]
MHRPPRTSVLSLLMALTWIACAPPDPARDVISIDPTSDSLTARLEPLARAIGDRRIVLIGENGHGVGDHTRLKVRLVEWLHDELGFDVVAMESGFFECGEVWRRVSALEPRQALYDCLRYPFQHAEILPMFERIVAAAEADRPLELAGVDPQAQGFDSATRPARVAEILSPVDADLAARIAAIDSAVFLPASSGGQGDSVYVWMTANGEAAHTAYDSAIARTSGRDRWIFLLGKAWLERLSVRAAAEAAGAGRPTRYYEVRDEWMARAALALADSIAGQRKVVVWLHNDHARYGDFDLGGGYTVRSVGGFLREWAPREVFSIGLFMGSGRVVDNARQERTVEPAPADGIEETLAVPGHPASYLLLGPTLRQDLRVWADSARPYLRGGTEMMEMVPATEFDALFYVDRVAPPGFEIPRE